MRNLLLAALTIWAGGASDSGAQPKNHIGQPLADVFAKGGCEMAEKEAHDALVAAGWFSSDFQAQAVALGNDGYLVSPAEGRLKLVNWGPCK